MARILVSIAASVVLAVIGYLLLFSGAWPYSRLIAQFRDGQSLVPSLTLMFGGILVLAAAMLTLALSPAGVVIVGSVHLVAGVIFATFPSVPISVVSGSASSGNGAVVAGALVAGGTGMVMLTGIVFLVAGLSRIGRTLHRPGALDRGLSLVVAIVVGPLAVVLAVLAGGGLFRNLYQLMNSELDVTNIILLAFATALLGTAMLMLRWSALGAIALGVILAGAGFFVLANLGAVRRLASDVSSELDAGIALVVPTGIIVLLGVLFIAAGIGAIIRSSVAWRADPFASATV